MSKLDRRQFASLMSLTGIGLMVAPMSMLTGCGTEQTSRTHSDANDSNATASVLYGVTVYDLMMHGYSNLGSGFLGQTGILKATMIRDGKAVTLNYIQDGDGHKFSLTPEDFEKLKKGQVVTVNTTKANGHDHRVVIDPKNRAPNAQSVEIPDPSNPVESIFVSVEEADEPRLFMQGSKPLDPASVEYCLDTKQACAADANLWNKSKIHLDQAGRQVLVSENGVMLDLNKAELPLVVRGKMKDSAGIIETILKLTRK
jgi:hypothetical protein